MGGKILEIAKFLKEKCFYSCWSNPGQGIELKTPFKFECQNWLDNISSIASTRNRNITSKLFYSFYSGGSLLTFGASGVTDYLLIGRN